MKAVLSDIKLEFSFPNFYFCRLSRCHHCQCLTYEYHEAESLEKEMYLDLTSHLHNYADVTQLSVGPSVSPSNVPRWDKVYQLRSVSVFGLSASTAFTTTQFMSHLDCGLPGLPLPIGCHQQPPD